MAGNQIKESKSRLKQGALSFVKSAFFDKTSHWGADLAIGQGSLQSDKAITPDGGHGHVYIFMNLDENFNAPIMAFGVEGAAPDNKNHSKTGASSEISPAGCSKFPELEKKLINSSDYKGTIIPQKYNGMFLEIDNNSAGKLMYGDDNIPSMVAIFKPSHNENEFFKEYLGNKKNNPIWAPQKLYLEKNKALSELYESLPNNPYERQFRIREG